MHPKNSITPQTVQALLTVVTGFCETPIDNKGTQMLEVVAGIDAADALQKAKTLSSGLGQICDHMHDSVNIGEMVYCDSVKTLAFLAETVSALIWSVQKSQRAEAGQ
ncbi:hypothetical protein [Pseudomonas syringae]|uniref:DUF3077 domain-containing protein n=1 Tax=Pseudomonas syringae TaxID=317 RepID=A0A085V6P4_PSESX|nr:hypothetical protein [Pseudomonas syringae]KFE51107.1 hypothetical protein IV02_13945 [Pseudomonas syringae]